MSLFCEKLIVLFFPTAASQLSPKIKESEGLALKNFFLLGLLSSVKTNSNLLSASTVY